jgi:hypothetical protein
MEHGVVGIADFADIRGFGMAAVADLADLAGMWGDAGG